MKNKIPWGWFSAGLSWRFWGLGFHRVNWESGCEFSDIQLWELDLGPLYLMVNFGGK